MFHYLPAFVTAYGYTVGVLLGTLAALFFLYIRMAHKGNDRADFIHLKEGKHSHKHHSHHHFFS